MPRFGGFVQNSFTGALINNALGSVANAVLPRSVFGGFGAQSLGSIVGQNALQQNPDNRRVTLKPKPAATSRVLGNGLLNPLKETGGLVWPYTPTIQYSSEVDYQSIQTVHANQDFHVYSKTPAVTLTVEGDFTVQNQKEGQYALAAIHFLRTMSKMNFGENDPLAGTPPPVLLFNAYGQFVFHNLPVIVKGFNIAFGNDVDYVQVKAAGSTTTTTTTPAVAAQREGSITREDLPAMGGGYSSTVQETLNRISGNTGSATTPGIIAGRVVPLSGSPGSTNSVTAASNYTVWLPSHFKISATLIVQHTPKQLRSTFNLPAFRDGSNNQSSFI